MKTPPGIFEYCKRKFASSDLHLLPSLWRRRSLKSDEPRLSSASGLLAKPGSVETILKHDTRTHALESRAIRPKMSHGRHRGLTERARTGVFLIAPRRSENSPAAANTKKQTLKRRQAIPPARSQSEFQAWRRHCNKPQPGGHAALLEEAGFKGDHELARSRTPTGGAQVCWGTHSAQAKHHASKNFKPKSGNVSFKGSSAPRVETAAWTAATAVGADRCDPPKNAHNTTKSGSSQQGLHGVFSKSLRRT